MHAPSSAGASTPPLSTSSPEAGSGTGGNVRSPLELLMEHYGKSCGTPVRLLDPFCFQFGDVRTVICFYF